MSFALQYMIGDQVLVTGTDSRGTSGSTVLDGSEWARITEHNEYSTKVEAFDAAVEEFFAPLVEAAEAVGTPTKPTDSISYVVLEEKTEGVEANAGTIVELTQDSVIIRLIEDDDTGRLVWVDPSTLGVLALS